MNSNANIIKLLMCPCALVRMPGPCVCVYGPVYTVLLFMSPLGRVSIYPSVRNPGVHDALHY